MAVGYNNVDVAACTARGVLVTNTPDVLTETTADFGFALMMATARRIAESEHFLRSGQWNKWAYDMFTGPDVHGATLGILGMVERAALLGGTCQAGPAPGGWAVTAVLPRVGWAS